MLAARRARAMSSRIRLASAGEAPPVETRDDDRVAADDRRQDEVAELGVVGDVAEHARAPRRRGARGSFTARSSVAAITRKRSSSVGRARTRGGRSDRQAPQLRRRPRGATTVTRAPQSSRPCTFSSRDRGRRRRRGSRGRAGRGTPCSSAHVAITRRSSRAARRPRRAGPTTSSPSGLDRDA